MMVSGGDTKVLEDLLSVVSDSDAAKKRLNDLMDGIRASQATMAKLQETQKSLDATKSDLEKMHAELAVKIANHSNDTKVQADAFAKQASDLAKREADVTNYLNVVKAREKELESKTIDLAILKKAHEDQLAKDTSAAQDKLAADKARVDQAHKAKDEQLAQLSATLVAKETKLDSDLKAAALDKTYWEEKVGALKSVLK